jgi:microcystin-dependent protein
MDPFVGEIRLMPYTFAPMGWALCQGQLLAIQSNTALFSLLGTRYGGNGTTTFALPDLRGRAAIGMGQGAGLQPYQQGMAVGTENVTVLQTQLAPHSHSLTAPIPANGTRGTSNTPQGGFYALTSSEQYGTTANNGNMATLLSGTTSVVGGTQPHENRMPFIVLNYCIALQGIFPQRQ